MLHSYTVKNKHRHQQKRLDSSEIDKYKILNDKRVSQSNKEYIFKNSMVMMAS